MTKADRNKRYNEKHADTLALKRKRVQEEKSEEQRQKDRAADRERKRRQKANQTPAEKAAQHQKDADSYRRRSAALTDEQRSVVRERMRATEKRLRLAKQHGPKQFCLGRAARYKADSQPNANYKQLADPGFMILPRAADGRVSDWLKAAKKVVNTQPGRALFSSVSKTGKLQHSSKRKEYRLQTHPELQDEVIAWTTELLQQQFDHYNVVDPVIISNGNTAAQPAHCDIKDQSHLWREDPPLSGIIALEDNTLLLVMRNSLESYEGQLEAVALNAGDVLIFHALLVHAGGSYSRTNRRIHFTALSQNGMSRPINETYVV